MNINIYTFYPFLSGVFPILLLWVKNIVEVPFKMFFKCFIVYAFLFSLFTLIISSLFDNIEYINWFLFLSVVMFYKGGKLIQKIIDPKKTINLIVKILTLFVFLSLYFIKDIKILSIFGYILLAFYGIFSFLLLIKAFIFYFRKNNKISAQSIKNETIKPVNPKNKQDLPDIYFIIPDGYANHNILSEKFNYDNSDFINFLKGKGFYINSDAICNYTFTEASMGSVLNLNFIDKFFKLDKNVDFSANMQNYLQHYCNNALNQILKDNGYQFIHLLNQTERIWGYCNQDGATEIISGNLNEFIKVLLMNSLLSVLQKKYLDKANRKHMIDYFDKLESVSSYQNDSPSFVYAHINCPHPPYLFDENGNMPNEKLDWLDLDDNNKLYLKQLTYLNTRLKNTVNNILNNGRKREKVIIIQSDHGCCMHLDTLNKHMDKNIWDQRRFVLRAIYSTRSLNFKFNSNVNLFRCIFNTYLGYNFEKLPEVTYHSDSSEISNKIFEFFDGNKIFK